MHSYNFTCIIHCNVVRITVAIVVFYCCGAFGVQHLKFIALSSRYQYPPDDTLFKADVLP